MAEVHHLPLKYVRKKPKARPFPLVFLLFLAFLFVLITKSRAFDVGRGFSRCPSNQFTCTDGSCILHEKMCDGRHDCADNSDEANCDTSKMCRQPNWFQCMPAMHGPCLSAELICNGVENCPGAEDELNCAYGRQGTASTSGSTDIGTGGWNSKKTRNCTAYEYTCKTDKSCIPLDFMCDGKPDCSDESDEVAGCLKAKANCQGFFCDNNSKCLESKKWVCDGVDDCDDGSDERNCSWNCKPEFGKFLCHDNFTCLALAKACDNTIDCPDRSDESARCNSPTDKCATKVCPMAAQCHQLPDEGAACLCPTGYRHSLLQNACVDIDECLENFGICSQRCENTAGAYRCSCDEGYRLHEDNKTCLANGEEALLLYTTQVAVMGVKLRTQRVYTVAKNLTKVIGVSYDGEHVYWTNIQSEAESIVKSSADGVHQEILLTSGLDAPEDLAVDWLTGNIYFSDNVLRHIAVCSNDGLHCAILVTVDVHQPRGIALWPQRGQMYWTDWGTKPMIARASMDGSHSMPIVTEDLHWPNGIALDMHNDRIYWVDAKFATIESARPDGKDRRKVLNEILKHPYGLAVFEDKLYWSDWGTKSVHMCNKFTGKNHKVISKDRTTYAVHVYHAAKQPKVAHACQNSRCSHMCLLAAGNSSTCACPDGMQLSQDRLRCIKMEKRQRLFMGLRNTLLEMEHTTFGRHMITKTHHLPMFISEMAYNSVNGSIFVADNVERAIYEYDLRTNDAALLARGNLGNITALAFDHISQNLYWSDSERHVVEVLSLRTHHRAITNFFSGMEAPIGLSVIPEDGKMFIALRNRRQVHIDQISLSGRGKHMHVFEDELGIGEFKLMPDYESGTLYWSDSNLGRISFSDFHNLHAYTFRSRLKRPYSIAIVDEDLFWSELRSGTIHWTHKSNMGPLKRMEIEVTKEVFSHMLPARIPLAASSPAMLVDSPCQRANGGCSHICIGMHQTVDCLCPAGLVYRDATNRTCIEALDCEFRCGSGECLTQSRRCNGRKDCPDGSDEVGCDPMKAKQSKVVCAVGKFMCHDAQQCLENELRCDGHKDCNDGSDEEHCTNFDKSKNCHRHQHACDNGNCVDFSVMCDGNDDCGDGSDESNCKMSSDKEAVNRPVCDKDMFQCNSGTCIAKTWECDGKLDCTDGSDEHEKCVLHDCPKNMHRCLLGQCIDARLVCDEHNDCGDYSDELNCDYNAGKKKDMICGNSEHPMYQCSSDASICLPFTAKCNGTAECPRGEDEADCGELCSFYEFQCKSNKECIRMEFRCDHEKDCADGSDEVNCERAFNATNGQLTSTHERACEANMYDCKDGQCVDATRVCDGFPDCDTGADEGEQCRTACKSSSSQPVCAHKCRATPMGAVCSCFPGYKLDADQRGCLDINECEELDPCAQICENTHGSYRCSCYPDFMLATDKTVCKSIDSNSKLMFTTYSEVRSMSDQPIVLRVAWSANDSRISGFDLDTRRRLAYFSTDSENVLYKVDMESGMIKSSLEVQMPTKVAVDWITGNVYAISRTQRYEIKICSFTARMCGRILQVFPRETIKALTVDALNRKLFYVTTRTLAFGANSQITVAALDGNKREMLFSKSGSYITALATDPHKKLLYYVDSHTKSLEAINYKLGSNRTPLKIIQKGNIIMHPSGLSIYENQAFIVNIGAKEAVRCRLFGTRECKAFNLNILNAEDIVVDGVSRQPLDRDPCVMAKCSGICLQAEYGYECMCGDRIVAENEICATDATNSVSYEKIDDEHATSHAGITAGVILLLIVLLVAARFGYMYYRRYMQGHHAFNINLHFQNPLSTFAGGSGQGNEKSTATMSSCSSSASGNSNDTTNTAATEVTRTPFHRSMYRFLRGSTQQNNAEIQLESTQTQQHIVPKMEQQQQQQHTIQGILVEDIADYDTAGSNGHHDDDPRARLVP